MGQTQVQTDIGMLYWQLKSHDFPKCLANSDKLPNKVKI